MERNLINSEVVKALVMLGYEDYKQLPTLQKVRKIFFNCARMHHPDKNSKADTKTKEEKEEMFKKIMNAYKIVAEVIIEAEALTEEDEFDEDEEEEYETSY